MEIYSSSRFIVKKIRIHRASTDYSIFSSGTNMEIRPASEPYFLLRRWSFSRKEE